MFISKYSSSIDHLFHNSILFTVPSTGRSTTSPNESCFGSRLLPEILICFAQSNRPRVMPVKLYLAIFSGQLLRSLLFTILKHCFQNDKRSRVLKSFVDFCLTNALSFEDPPVSPTEIQLWHDYKQNQQARPTQPKAIYFFAQRKPGRKRKVVSYSTTKFKKVKCLVVFF